MEDNPVAEEPWSTETRSKTVAEAKSIAYQALTVCGILTWVAVVVPLVISVWRWAL